MAALPCSVLKAGGKDPWQFKSVEIKNTILQCVTFKEQDINGKIQKVISGAAE